MTKTNFQYLSKKILDAEFDNYPFKHLLIEDFLSDEHLNIILNDSQIHFEKVDTTEEVINLLFENDYKIQEFPGCSIDIKDYLYRYKNNNFPSERHGTPVESFGITFRLNKYNNPIIEQIIQYMNGHEFKTALETKFKIIMTTNILSAIQKNLSHYEISPHPDIRQKALTYLLNINKDSSIENESVHTHLLKFKDEWKAIPEYWKNTLHKNRCWVPWNWCETIINVNKNNSFVLFSPDVTTLHGVKLYYDHTKFQRTQIYGNLMGVGPYTPQMNYKELKFLHNT